MEQEFWRFTQNLYDRLGGPLHARFFIQPVMAALLGIWGGWKDAKTGKPPFLQMLLQGRGHRRALLMEAWHGAGRVLLLVLVVDVIYQIVELGFFYPGEALAVGLVVAALPYLLARGLANRIVTFWRR